MQPVPVGQLPFQLCPDVPWEVLSGGRSKPCVRLETSFDLFNLLLEIPFSYPFNRPKALHIKIRIVNASLLNLMARD